MLGFEWCCFGVMCVLVVLFCLLITVGCSWMCDFFAVLLCCLEFVGFVEMI